MYKRVISYLALLVFCLSSCKTDLPVQKFNSPEPTALATQPVSIDPKPVRIKISAIQEHNTARQWMVKLVSGVEGIVTALKERGFYMQDPEPDDDESSSDAIFVKMLGYTNKKSW